MFLSAFRSKKPAAKSHFRYPVPLLHCNITWRFLSQRDWWRSMKVYVTVTYSYTQKTQDCWRNPKGETHGSRNMWKWVGLNWSEWLSDLEESACHSVNEILVRFHSQNKVKAPIKESKAKTHFQYINQTTPSFISRETESYFSRIPRYFVHDSYWSANHIITLLFLWWPPGATYVGLSPLYSHNSPIWVWGRERETCPSYAIWLPKTALGGQHFRREGRCHICWHEIPLNLSSQSCQFLQRNRFL